jgi:hypothetical protein
VHGVKGSDSEATRIAALQVILDRAYGKARQPVDGEMTYGISEELRKFVESNKDAARHFVGEFDFSEELGLGDAQGPADKGPVSHH